MTFAERISLVRALGYSLRQATFLTTVALHSGYCLRRQYAAFTGLKNGNYMKDFLDGLVEQNLANRIVYRANRGSIYHVFGRRIYRAICDKNSTNRRHCSPAVIARKLMVLDFVLAHLDFDWYATEGDKVDLFLSRLSVPSDVLPKQLSDQRERRTQKMPIFLNGTSSCVNFVCLVTDPHGSAIERFIHEHAPLLRHLSEWTVTAVIPQRYANDQGCEATYRRALVAASVTSPSRDELDWFTNTRALVASGDLRTLNLDDLRRYRTLSTTLGQGLESHVIKPLVVYHLPHSYCQFGSFPGVT